MKSLRSALMAMTALVGVALFGAQAGAVGPGQTALIVNPQYNVYQASIIALTPASSATDVFTINGSATKQVWIHNITCTGTSTAAQSIPVQLSMRSTSNTGGTSTTPVAVPVNSTQPAATATVAAYTANPTTGTSIGPVAVGLLQTPAPASIGASNGLTFDFSADDPLPNLVLNGATQSVSVNANGQSFAAGTSLSCFVMWSEH